MQIESTSSQPSPMTGALKFFFASAIFLIPFNGILTSAIFGEFQSESAFYIFLPLVLLSLPKSSLPKSPLFILAILLLGSIVISTFANLTEVLDASLRGRSGANKLITSAMVVGFMLFFAEFIERNLRQRPGTLLDIIFRYSIYVTIFMMVMSLFQLASFHSGSIETIYRHVIAVIRPMKGYGEVGRIDTVSFEPSVFTLYLCAVLALSLGLKGFFSKKSNWLLTFIFIPALTGLIFIAGARTGVVCATAIWGAHLIYRVFLSTKKMSPVGQFLLAAGPAVLLISIHIIIFSEHENVMRAVLGDVSISNLSRYATLTACLEIFKEYMYFGAGLGQYAFHAEKVMPSWGWYSYEIVNSFEDSVNMPWPPAHSFLMRMLAELGVFGVICYFGVMTWLVSMMVKTMFHEKMRTQTYPWVGHTFLLGWVFACFSGIGYDSYRQFMVWIFIGGIAAYISVQNPETTLIQRIKKKEMDKSLLPNPTTTGKA